MEEMYELSETKQELFDRVSNIMNKANEYRNSFSTYEYLWVDDRQEFMRQFLLYNHVLTAEEIEMHADEGVPENPPTLEQFKEQVNFHIYLVSFKIAAFEIYAFPFPLTSLRPFLIKSELTRLISSSFC